MRDMSCVSQHVATSSSGADASSGKLDPVLAAIAERDDELALGTDLQPMAAGSGSRGEAGAECRSAQLRIEIDEAPRAAGANHRTDYFRDLPLAPLSCCEHRG